MNLDPQQQAAVDSTDPVTIVIAGPGSGKTRTMVERIRHRIANGADPRRMAVMTFTNAGANELRERLGDIQLGYLGTLHGYCFRLLQRCGGAIGYREGGINLLAPDLADELLNQIGAELRYKGSAKSLREARDPLAQLCHKEYRHRMKRNNLVDYDGVLTGAIELLERNAFTVDLDELYVDEGQDSGQADWEIYRLLMARFKFIVGDPDQSVFAFRGAYPQGFIDACQQAPTPTVVRLETNYRSGSEICRAADNLIRCNPGRLEKDMKAVPESGHWNHGHGYVYVTNYSTDQEERNGIAEAILRQMHEGQTTPGEIAILCRTHAIRTATEQGLRAYGIPIRQQAARQWPRDLMAALDVLSLCADPRNDLIAMLVLKRIAAERSPEATSTAIRNGIWLSVAAWPGIFCPSSSDGRKGARESLPDVMALLPRFGIDKETCGLIGERISQLPQAEPTLADLRHDLFNKDQWEDEPTIERGVMISTIHAAKGREWDVVFLPAWEEGIVPSLRRDSDPLEERRLAFVAITRARHLVHISSVQSRRTPFGKIDQNPPSRFIAETKPDPAP